jgi:hypothetical protein
MASENAVIKILGYGEIGKSIGKCLENKGLKFGYKDLKETKGPEKCDILHVCIPFSEEFAREVCLEVQSSGARVVIIHSTVRPGITHAIQWNLCNEDGKIRYEKIEVVHSPVIGVHPNLYEGLMTFKKWVGYDHPATKAISHLCDLGLQVYPVEGTKITEILKLLCTTYYGMCIAFTWDAKKFLTLNGIDFDFFAEWNRNYNEGYQKLGMDHVTRPILKADDKVIGGHCVIPNSKILRDFDSFSIDMIRKYSK